MILAVGLFLAVSSIARVVFLVLDWKRDCRTFAEGISVDAVITDRITYPNADDLQSSQYRLIAEYKDSSGETHFVRSRGHLCGAESREMIGKEFEVVYSRDNPEQAIFTADRKKHISYWAIAGNSIAFLAGSLLVLAHFLAD